MKKFMLIFTTSFVAGLICFAEPVEKPVEKSSEKSSEKPSEDKTLTPSGLTIVVMDKANKVLDTVVIGDEKKSLVVSFAIPDGEEMIRVFAIGHRINKDLPKNFYILGRPDDEKWHGLGYVDVDIEEGILIGIKGNGMGQFEFTKAMQEEVAVDLKAAKAASITTIEESDGEAADDEDRIQKAEQAVAPASKSTSPVRGSED